MTRLKTAFYIALFTLLIYANSLGGSFIGDDKGFVVHNRYVKSPENAAQFFADPSAAAEGGLKGDVYRPITTLSYALDYAFWRLNPFGFHLTNIAFHAANAALVFVLVLLITGDRFIAVSTALLFSSHPVQTEAVSWISGRSNCLFLFFYLLSFIFYILSFRPLTPKGGEGRVRGVYAASLLCFALSLFSKEMAVTLPVILIVYDIHFSEGMPVKERVLRCLPYFALAVFFVASRSVVLGKLGQFEGWGAPYRVFLTMLTVVVDYIRILFLPIRLYTANYIIPFAESLFETRVIYSISVLAALAAAVPMLFRRSRFVSFSIWWFFVTLLPVLNIVPIKALQSERFLYLPSIGFCACLAAAAAYLNRRFGRPVAGRAALGVLIVGALVAAYSVRTVMRNEDWKDELTMYRKMVAAYPDSTWALKVLGGCLLEAEEYAEALAVYRRAVGLERYDPESRGALGLCCLKLERYEEAAAELKEAVRLNPQNSIIRNALGVAYINLNQCEDAKKQLHVALKCDPEFMAPALNLGRLKENEGSPRDAIKIYASALGRVETREEVLVLFLRIGDAYRRMSEPAKAREYYEKARKLYGPDASDAFRKILEEKEKGL